MCIRGIHSFVTSSVYVIQSYSFVYGIVQVKVQRQLLDDSCALKIATSYPLASIESANACFLEKVLYILVLNLRLLATKSLSGLKL